MGYHRFLHWMYILLSLCPDLRRIRFYFACIARLRAIVLGWQPNKTVGRGVEIWRGCRFPLASKIAIGEDCVIKEFVVVGGEFTLGARSVILAYTKIDGSGGVWIGSGTQVGRYNVIFSHAHDVSRRDVPVLEAPEVYKPVEVGSDVMLFSRVAIMPGVSIGDGAVVGYGSVVTSDLKMFGIYAGVPARRVGSRK